MTPFLQHILAVHGGTTRWRRFSKLDAEVSAWGFLFTLKGVAPLNHARLTLNTLRPEVVFHDFPQAGQTTRFLDGLRMETVNKAGQMLTYREQPRLHLMSWNPLQHWDALDQAYFCGYALWNYLCLPQLLLFPGVQVTETPSRNGDGTLSLTVDFPSTLPTHCAQQVFHFNGAGHLIRHEYIDEAAGMWSKAVNVASEYRKFAGISMPTSRRIYTTALGSLPLPFPPLVGVDIHNVVPS